MAHQYRDLVAAEVSPPIDHPRDRGRMAHRNAHPIRIRIGGHDQISSQLIGGDFAGGLVLVATVDDVVADVAHEARGGSRGT